MKKKTTTKLIASMAISILMVSLSVSSTVLATNVATQNATTNAVASIVVQDQNYTTEITSLTFPAAAPSTTVSNPTNSDSEIQVLATGASGKPVVTLLNNNAAALDIWYNITTFSNAIVTTEHYLIVAKAVGCADEATIANAVTFDADTVTVGPTSIAAGADNEMDLYLKIGLSAVAGKAGTSTLTILGETA